MPRKATFTKHRHKTVITLAALAWRNRRKSPRARSSSPPTRRRSRPELAADGGGRAPIQVAVRHPQGQAGDHRIVDAVPQLFCEFIEFRMRNNTFIKIRTRISKGKVYPGGTNVENCQATKSFFRKRAFRWSAGCDCAGEGQGQGWFHRAVDRGRFSQWDRRAKTRRTSR